MKIAVVDDDAAVYERMRGYIAELLGDSAEICSFPSGEDFLSVWKKELFDLVILDIFMGKLTGMEVARKIRETDKTVKIAFCTTSNEFASESYEVDACYYLHKPFGRDNIRAMLDRLSLSEIERMRTVGLPDGSAVRLRDIVFADFSSHKVTLHCKSGDRVVRSSFSEIEPVLCAYPYFFSPSKGIIVNFYEISAQSDDTFALSDGSVVPISRRKAKEVLEAYSSFRFELLRNGGKK